MNNVNSDVKGIIICTFTRKATEELKTRLYSKIPYEKVNKINLVIGTIHSICYHLLSNYSEGVYSDYSILPEDIQITFIYSKLENLGFSSEVIKKRGWQLSEDLGLIFNKITDENLDIDSLCYNDEPDIETYCKVYPTYVKLLKKFKLLDFATIQSTFLNEFRTNVEFKKRVTLDFSHFFVDEYQDVNDLQNEIFLEIAGPNYNIVVVGDDDQSIYGFRGAKVGNILSFKSNILRKGIKKIKEDILNRNYRSTENIVAFTNTILINAEYPRIEKKIIANRRENGLKPLIKEFETDADEAEFISQTIKSLKGKNIIKYKEVAILFRSAKSHSMPFQEALKHHGIPFKLIGTGNFFESILANEFLALLDFVLRNDGDLNSFNIAINKIDTTYGSSLKRDYSKYNLFSRIQNIILAKKKYKSCIDITYDLFFASKFIERYNGQGENIGVLTSLIFNFDEYSDYYNPYGLWSYLSYLKRTQKIDLIDNNDADYVTLMTIHQAKGLEFNCIFLPSQNERSSISTLLDKFYKIINEDRILHDEERRVFYVGTTRAKDLLCITYSKKLKSTKKTYNANKFVREFFNKKQLISNHINLDEIDRKSFNINCKDEKKNLILSYNKIRLYKICPLAYRYSCVWNLQTVRTGGLQFGSNIHKILEIIIRTIKNGLYIDNQAIDEIITKYWNSAKFRSENENKKFINSAKEQIKTAYNKFLSQLPPENIFSVEDEFNIFLNGNLINGRFDLCLKFNDNYEIIDFKTGDYHDYSSQLSFYSVCFTQKYNSKNPKLHVYFLKDGKIATINPRQPIEEIKEIYDITEKIKNNIFDPNPGKHCLDCAYNNICERY